MKTTMTTREAIGAELRELRAARGLTQAAAAHRARIAPSYVSLIENGHRDVTLGTLGALARAYDAVLTLKIRRRAG